MRNALIFTLIAAIAIAGAASADPAAADAGAPGASLIVAVDSLVVSSNARDALVADSVTRLAPGTRESGTIALMSYGFGPGKISEFSYGSAALIEGMDAFQQLLATRGATGESDQIRAIAAGFGYLTDSDALAGSRLLLVTSDGMDSASRAARDRVAALAELFPPQGWTMDVAILPSASPSARDFLARLARVAGGRSYDTGAIDGLSNFASDIYGIAPSPVIQTVLERGANALAPIDLPPFTDLMTLSATRRSPDTIVELFDPRGAPVTAVRSNVTVVETGAAILIRVSSPEAGQWTARALGDESELLIGVDIEHGLGITLADARPVPVGEPALLTATVTSHGSPVVLESAFIEATVTTASGSAVYRMGDEGVAGDLAAGDGIFSVLIPPFEEQATTDVGLVLRWDNFAATVRDSATLKAEDFPTVSVRNLAPPPVMQGEFVDVAEVRITKAGFPFPVDQSLVSAAVISPNRRPITSKLSALDVLDDGTAWQFTVSAAPQGTGDYRVEASLDTAYLDREYATSGSVGGVDLGVILPPVVVVVPVPETGALESVPAWAWALIAIAVVMVAAALAQRLLARSQRRPYGYLYDDSGKVLIDFTGAPQTLFRRLFARNRVSTSCLPDPAAFGKGEFVFSDDEVVLRIDSRAPNIRVNGRPAEPVTPLTGEVRLGVGGRLLRFMARPATPPLPNAGD